MLEEEGLVKSYGHERTTHHRVTLPDDDVPCLFDGLDMPRQELFHLVGAISTDQRHLSRDIIRIHDCG